MKKSLCIILSAAMIALTFAACTKKDDNKNADITTMTNANGEAYVNVTDKNGEAVTNADGANVTSVLSDKEKSSIAATTAAKANGTTKKATADKTTSAKANVNASTKPFDITAAKEDLAPEGTTAKKTSLRDDVVIKQIKSGKFTIKANIISNGTKMPITIAIDGKKLGCELTYMSILARVLVLDDKTYLVLPATNMYMEMSGEEFSGLGDFTAINDDQTYVGTSKTKINSKTYTCEEYKSKDGTVIKYYFDSKQWVRLEVIDGDNISVMEIVSLSDKVSSTMFNLSGYKKQDLSALTGATTKKAS